ncbi:MAG: elongation factor 1-beta [Candidatus Woesearchaeota archaeon]
MANVIVTLKIMPKGPDVDLDKVYANACKYIRDFVDKKHKDGEMRKEIEPIGFGLKALKILFVMDEAMGTTDKLEDNIRRLPDVESVEAIDVRRAVG